MSEGLRGPRRHRPPRDDRGAVLVEFAAMVPFMMLALALVWQVLLIGLTSMYASHGAAEAARQASVTPDDMARIDEEARKRVRPPWDAEDVLTTEVVERDRVTGLHRDVLAREQPGHLLVRRQQLLRAPLTDGDHGAAGRQRDPRRLPGQPAHLPALPGRGLQRCQPLRPARSPGRG